MDQAPTLSTHTEAELIKDIHKLLPKEMNIQTKEETKNMLQKLFEVHEASHQSRPLPTEKNNFLKRYEINDQAKIEEYTQKIIELINNVPQEQRPNVWVNKETGDFGWTIPFTIYKCKKLLEKNETNNEI